jgi:hypothetical protein
MLPLARVTVAQLRWQTRPVLFPGRSTRIHSVMLPLCGSFGHSRQMAVVVVPGQVAEVPHTAGCIVLGIVGGLALLLWGRRVDVSVGRVERTSPLDLEGLENGIQHADAPALVVNAGCGDDLGFGDAVVEVEVAAAEGLDELAPPEVTPVVVEFAPLV